MSYTELIESLREYLPDDPVAMGLLDEIYDSTLPYWPDDTASRLEAALEQEDWLEDATKLVDELEKALKRGFTPVYEQQNAFKKDMDNWFTFAHAFLEAERSDGLVDLMDLYWKMFNPKGKEKCGALRVSCRGDDCRFHFTPGVYICPECGSTRTLCRKRVATNGRCVSEGRALGHGGDQTKGALHPTYIDGRKTTRRSEMFANQIKNRPNLKAMYIQALQDPDYLSLMPEIALLAARRGELLADLDAIDPETIEREVASAVEQMQKAMMNDKYGTVIFYAQKVEDLLTKGKENRNRWRELNSIATQMAKLVDTERKTIVEARRSVPIEDMFRLQQETIKVVRVAIGSGAEEIYFALRSALGEDADLGRVTVDFIRGRMLKHMANELRPIQEAEDREIINIAAEERDK
jgi:HPt (histidine-containing phosphotransfer) domain-containing protein